MKWASVLLRAATPGRWSMPGGLPARAVYDVPPKPPHWRETAIATPRCIVRAAQPEDAHVLFDASLRPEFNRWLTWERPLEVSTIEQRFAQQLRAWQRGQSLCFSVIDKTSGQVLGGADLKPDAFVRHWGTRNLGYWTHPEYQNQGYAREFVPAVVTWAFWSGGIARLLAGAAPQNAASCRILVGLGFAPFERRTVGKPERQFENIRYVKLNPRHSA